MIILQILFYFTPNMYAQSASPVIDGLHLGMNWPEAINRMQKLSADKNIDLFLYDEHDGQWAVITDYVAINKKFNDNVEFIMYFPKIFGSDEIDAGTMEEICKAHDIPLGKLINTKDKYNKDITVFPGADYVALFRPGDISLLSRERLSNDQNMSATLSKILKIENN